MRNLFLAGVLALAIAAAGCAGPKVKLFTDATDPLQEHVLSGKSADKILILPVSGMITDSPRKAFLRQMPGAVQEAVSQLRKAEADRDIKAVVLKINSPGGTATASDILYREIMEYKAHSGAVVVALFMDVAASGGYYIALPADRILAHPTTVTGSVGAVFLRPKFDKLMDKIGLSVEVDKSGDLKDMGSPFRETRPEEAKILKAMVSEMGARFQKLTAEHRHLSPKVMKEVATARVYMGQEAMDIGPVDAVGYVKDALATARELARLPEDAKVVVYRRTEFPDDNVYNTIEAKAGAGAPVLVDLGGLTPPALTPGFYYFWTPGVDF